MTNLCSLLWGNRFCRVQFTSVLVCLDHVSLLVMWTPRNLKLTKPSPLQPVDMNGGVLSPPFPIVHNHLLCLDHVEGEVVVLAPYSQVSDLLPIGCLIVVISKLNDGVGVVPGSAVMSEQGVQEGAEPAPRRGPRGKDKRGRCVYETAALPFTTRTSSLSLLTTQQW